MTFWPCIRCLAFLYPRFNEVEGGILVSPCPLVRLCTESCSLCSFHNTCSTHFIFTHLIKKLQTACCVWRFYSKFKYLICWQILKIHKFDFVLFWLEIQYESIVRVIMGQRGVSRERKRSSCSGFINFLLYISNYTRYSKQLVQKRLVSVPKASVFDTMDYQRFISVSVQCHHALFGYLWGM